MKLLIELAFIALGFATLFSIYHGPALMDYQILSYYFFLSMALLARRLLIIGKGLPTIIRNRGLGNDQQR